MVWRLETYEDTCNYKTGKKCLQLFMKPKISRRLSDIIYLTAVSPNQKRRIIIALTFEEAKRLVKEIEEHIETHRRVKQLIACWRLNEMFEKIEE